MQSFIKVSTKDGYELLHSQDSKDIYYELYRIINNNEGQQLELSRKRLDNPYPYHPRVLKIQIKDIKGNIPYYLLVLEHTVFRLSQIQHNIEKETKRSLSLLVAQTIIGFSSLFNQFGAFKVKNNMIGFDKQGRIKVWINNNFGKNIINPFYHTISDSETSMLNNIIDIFQSYGYKNEELNRIISFEEALGYLRKNIKDNQIQKQLNPLKKQKMFQRTNQKFEIPTTPKHKSSQQIAFNEFKSNSFQDQTSDKIFSNNSRTKPKQTHQTTQKDSNRRLIFPQKQPEDLRTYSIIDDDCLIIRRKINIPDFCDEIRAKEYLANNNVPLEEKVNYIDYLLQLRDLNSSVKQLANVYKFAITKDTDLYKALLEHKSNISSLPLQYLKKIDQMKRNLYQSNSISSKQLKTDKINQQSNVMQLPEITFAAKSNEQKEDQSRMNIHIVPTEITHQHPTISHKLINKHVIPQIPHKFNKIPQIPRPRINYPQQDQFLTTHSQIPYSDYKLTLSNMNKNQIPQPRSHEKLQNPRQSKPYIALTSKNPTNFRDHIFKYNIKQA